MRTFRFLAGYISFLLAGLIGGAAPNAGVAFAQQSSEMSPEQQAQMEALQSAAQTEDHQERARMLDAFLAKYPDTPFKTDVYNMLFLSYREFSPDHDHVWMLGTRFLDELSAMADAQLPPVMKNPVLAEAYNSVAYEFAERGAHLDGALGYAQRSLALVQQAAMERPPNIDEEEWRMRTGVFRGQILDTLGWIQFKRRALPDAEKAITDALALIPENGTVYYHLGQVYAAGNQPQKAIDAYLMAVTAEQPDEAAHGELKRLYAARHGASGETKLTSDLKTARTRADRRLRQKVLANRVNAKAADVTFKRLNGEAVALSSLKGKVVVINFWATWCAPCREEMPALQKVWEAYKARNVAFVIASVDQEQDKIQPYIDRSKYTFPVYTGMAAAQTYGIESIPTTLVIDPQGMVQFMHIGYRPDIAQVLSWQIDALME